MQYIKSELQDRICTITLNRPEKMNAYHAAMHDELVRAIQDADKNPDVRCIVLTGAGKMFCAGADLESGFSDLATNPHKMHGISRDYGGMLNLAIFECNTAIVAAVNGNAVGIGLTMLLPCDIRIASSETKFAIPFTRRGIVFDGGASWMLPRLVGWGVAQRWAVTGETFKSDEALRTGLVHELAAPDEVLSRAMEIARDIAQNCAPQSIAQNKQLMRASLRDSYKYESGAMGAHLMESAMLNKRFVSDDCKEGVMSFFQKRPPEFNPHPIESD